MFARTPDQEAGAVWGPGLGCTFSVKQERALMTLRELLGYRQCFHEVGGGSLALTESFLKIYLFCACEHFAWIDPVHVHAWCLWKLEMEDDSRFPGAGLIDGCECSCGCWDLNSGSWQE